MKDTVALGILVTTAEGDSRLLPLAFTFRDGDWWAGAPLEFGDYLLACDGHTADILFLEGPAMHVRGVLHCGNPRDARHLVVRIVIDAEPHAGQDLPWAA